MQCHSGMHVRSKNLWDPIATHIHRIWGSGKANGSFTQRSEARPRAITTLLVLHFHAPQITPKNREMPAVDRPYCPVACPKRPGGTRKPQATSIQHLKSALKGLSSTHHPVSSTILFLEKLARGVGPFSRNLPFKRFRFLQFAFFLCFFSHTPYLQWW